MQAAAAPTLVPPPQPLPVLLPMPAGINRFGGTHTLARLQRSPEQVRCECLTCGCHAFALPDRTFEAECGNCGDSGLRPLDAGPKVGARKRRFRLL